MKVLVSSSPARLVAYHVIITRPELETLKAELPVIVGKWGSKFTINKAGKPKLIGCPVTSCKLFMTYAALQLRDNELLDVMYEARRLAITTVSRGKSVKCGG